ncbi:Cell division cycle-associated 7-like protein [Thalictrum thalictroides]|uniref:Cell division cycle-associated 7-like protein n=1 Tax=Thalictrum thalictroides TaxID=46969 RepID=A0A7J6VBP9_THATH|nr:Cell division cycle-associated 7-like protein [Thalictrum thalictroides]
MALSPTPNSNSSPSNQILSPPPPVPLPQLTNSTSKKRKSKKTVVDSQLIPTDLTHQPQPLQQIPLPPSFSSSPPRKRTKSPGVRVVGGRIYDSENGKTCHQCRQKTMDFVVPCKTQREDKPCALKFCHKCLLNRYGEKAEEADKVDDWKCPKCRDICNCSHCMKKRGHQPTNIRVHTAKASGFRSVMEMMTVNGSENNSVTPTMLYLTNKESSPDGNDDSHLKPIVSPSAGKKIRERKQIKLEEGDDNACGGSNNNGTQSKNWYLTHGNTAEEEFNERDYGGQEERKIRKTKWKDLARTKINGKEQGGPKEDGAQSEKLLET